MYLNNSSLVPYLGLDDGGKEGEFNFWESVLNNSSPVPYLGLDYGRRESLTLGKVYLNNSSLVPT